MSPGTEAGAYAFVKAYFAELDRAYATGDVSKLEPYRRASCSCLGFERDIRSYYGRGGKIVGEKFIIDRVVFGDHGPAFAEVGVAFRTPSVKNKLPNMASTTTDPESGSYALSLRRVANRYIVSEIQYRSGTL